MEEKEAKEDQGDDRHQVGRISAGSYWGLYGVWPNRRRDMFRLSWVSLNGCRDCCVVSWDAGDRPQGSVGTGTKKAGYRLETTLGEYPAKRIEMRS